MVQQLLCSLHQDSLVYSSESTRSVSQCCCRNTIHLEPSGRTLYSFDIIGLLIFFRQHLGFILGAHLSLSFARSRPGGTLTPPQAYIYPGVACATLVGSSLISRCGTRHTCWLIHHLRGVVLPPLFPCTYFTGCVTPTLRFAREHPTTLVPFTAKWFSTLLCTYISVRSC